VAEVPDFPGALQIVQGADGFLQGSRIIGEMQLVQIQVIGIQSHQTRFTGFYDVLPARTFIVRALSHGTSELARDDHRLTAALKGLSQHNLRVTPVVDIRRIVKADAGFKCRPDHLGGSSLIQFPPEVVAAQAQFADL
jgi:hypothetical protein